VGCNVYKCKGLINMQQPLPFLYIIDSILYSCREPGGNLVMSIQNGGTHENIVDNLCEKQWHVMF
jgi:hypothetical protein